MRGHSPALGCQLLAQIDECTVLEAARVHCALECKIFADVAAKRPSDKAWKVCLSLWPLSAIAQRLYERIR